MDDFVDMVSRFRFCWFAGRYGGGKTALGVHMAAQVCQAGLADKIVSNTPLRLPLIDVVDEKHVHEITYAVLLLDEAWRWLGRRSNAKVNDWLAYLRKRDQVLLLPSVLSLAPELRCLQIRRRWNLYPFGVPLWVYEWVLDDGTKFYKGGKGKHLGAKYYWWRPDKIFRLYDHSLPERADFGVYAWPKKQEKQQKQQQQKAA